MIRYKTVMAEASAEQTIEKSKFIAYVCPVESKEEADGFIARIRGLHRDATHNVPAMVIGEQFQIQWASDDGEPQGTSGAPMVQMLVKEGITNVAIVVTRYFGGIKLGPGGLVRAYTGSAKLGLEAAGICHVKELLTLKVKLDYTYLSKLQSLAQSGQKESGTDEGEGRPMSFQITDILYEDLITLDLAVEPEEAEALKNLLAGLTAGKAEILGEKLELVKKAC